MRALSRDESTTERILVSECEAVNSMCRDVDGMREPSSLSRVMGTFRMSQCLL